MEKIMPRVLVAIVLTLILIVYYIYKVNAEPLQTDENVKIHENKNADKDIKERVNNETVKNETVKKEIKKTVKKSKPVSQKKKEYYSMILPALDEVYNELQAQYQNTQTLIKKNPSSEQLLQLQKKYKVASNEALLIALKPHPKSIAIAQGAMESAWGTSRFYKQAYNIFGVWSFNKNDNRIAAGETRGKTTIWLKKYNSVKDSIADYYLTMSRSKAFKGFKKLNYEKENQNPYLLVKKLDRYSEKGALYGEELAAMISYNNFTQYDEIHYSKTKKRVKTIEVVDAIQESESSYGDILKDINATTK